MPTLKVIKHITIFALLLLFSSNVLAEKNEYPKKPNEVLKIALELMHKRNYNLGAEYYHPDFFKRSSKGIWESIKDKKQDDIFMYEIKFADIDGFKFVDEKLVELTSKELFINSLIGFQMVMDKMGTDVYKKAEVLNTVTKDSVTAFVDYQTVGLSVGQDHSTVETITHTATMKFVDGQWKIHRETLQKEKKN